MRSVGIKKLKNELSEHIRAVTAGETVLVTDRGKVVAEIVPPRSPIIPLSDAEVIAKLVREGMITPAKGRGAPMPPRLPPVMTFEELMKDLDESRSDR